MKVAGIEVEVNGLPDMSAEEIHRYIDYIHSTTDEKLSSLAISATADGKVALDYKLRPQKFERIRRITGYLVGTTDRWNNAKAAEEKDRVKHGLN